MISLPYVVEQYLDSCPEAEAVCFTLLTNTHKKIENHVVAGFLSAYLLDLLVLFSD